MSTNLFSDNNSNDACPLSVNSQEPFGSVKNRLCELRADLTAFSEQQPEVHGISKLLRRLEADLRLVNLIIDGEEEPNSSRLQGLKNNIDGLNAELLTAKQAPGVIAVGKRFYTPEVSSKGVEVDVVAQNGCLWIEVKKHHSFSTGSKMWEGKRGRSKGVLQQAREVLAAAKDPSHIINWQEPKVVFRFIGSVDISVRSELENLGVVVIEDKGVLDVSLLPECPTMIDRVNLDVTTLCSLVSEVSNGGAGSKEVDLWAKAHPHLAACVDAELLEPFLPSLLCALDGKTLFTSKTAMDKFYSILTTVGGEREQSRWEMVWKEKINIESISSGSGNPVSSRVLSLKGLSPFHKDVFGYGDCIQATTATANAKVVRSASEQGVILNVLLHRPVFLTGL